MLSRNLKKHILGSQKVSPGVCGMDGNPFFFALHIKIERNLLKAFNITLDEDFFCSLPKIWIYPSRGHVNYFFKNRVVEQRSLRNPALKHCKKCSKYFKHHAFFSSQSKSVKNFLKYFLIFTEDSVLNWWLHSPSY